MEGYFKRICDQRKQVAEKMAQVVCDLYPITAHMIAQRASCSTNIFKTHIMHVLMDAGYTSDIYGDLYKKLFGDGGKADFRPDFEDGTEIVKLIKSAGGLAVLAHPGMYGNMDAIPALIEAGLDGIELWHPKNSDSEKIEIEKICFENNLIMTGGSDFHGMYTTTPKPLGSISVGKDVITSLYHRKQKK
jgi:predicted metal-dependent phosphoesterase TrpH